VTPLGGARADFDAEPDLDYPVGVQERIGPFQIIREIGSGGMGVVSLAVDTRLDRQVAIKALPAQFAAVPARLERFEREAKILAGLAHPNIAGIHGVEEQDGNRYLVLEYVEGETLADRLDRGPLPVDEAIEFACQIAQGVEAAHEAGVIHRDLKPANIRITPEGVAKVLDFGLARADEGSSSSSGLDDPTQTADAPRPSPTLEGAILGTAAYMSPEQARGRRVDARTDVWSFGVVLFEMLVGASPFRGETASDSIGAVLHKSVDLQALPKDTPVKVRRALVRCLARDRADRYRSLADIRIELLAAEDDVDSAVRPRRSWSVFTAVAVAIVVIAAALSVAIVLRPGADPPRVVRSTIKAPDGIEMFNVSISPDGRRVLMVGRPIDPAARSSDARVVYVRDLDGAVWQRVGGSERSVYAEFSPDGRRIGILSAVEANEREFRIAPADLSSPAVATFRLDPMYYFPDGWITWWGPDRIALIAPAPQRLDVIDVGSGSVVSSVGVSEGQEKVLLAWSARLSERYAVIGTYRYEEGSGFNDLALLDLETGDSREFIRDASDPHLISETLLAFTRDESILVVEFDPETASVVGDFRVVEEDGRRSNWGHTRFAASDRGDLLYVEGGAQGMERRVVVTEPDGTERFFEEQGRPIIQLRISPDGERIAVTLVSAGGAFEVWVSEVDRPRLRRLLPRVRADIDSPVFMPGGDRLLVTRSTDERLELLLVSFDGSEEPLAVLGLPGGTFVSVNSVSPDGRWAWVRRFESGIVSRARLWLDGSERIDDPINDAAVWNVNESPDGSGLISFSSTSSGRPELFIARVEGDGITTPLPISAEPLWGHTWTYIGDQELAIRCVRPGGGRFFDLPVEIEIAADGRQRIVVGDPIENERVVDPRSVNGDLALTGRMIELKQDDNEAPATELTLIQGWRDRIRSKRR